MNTIHSSYSHTGRALRLSDAGGIYNNLDGIIYTSNLSISDNNAYGGVAVFENPVSGQNEYVLTSADMIDEGGPHGICTQDEGNFGTAGAPADPAGIIAYIPTPPTTTDLKGMGGDVYVFKACDVVILPYSDYGYRSRCMQR